MPLPALFLFLSFPGAGTETAISEVTRKQWRQKVSGAETPESLLGGKIPLLHLMSVKNKLLLGEAFEILLFIVTGIYYSD